MTLAALFIGVLVATQGIVGLVAPAFFLEVVRAFQTPPVIYFAAAVRLAIGIVLVLAAPKTRFPLAMRVLGVLIAIGGALTPIIGVQYAQAILGWWSQSVAVVRGFAAFALLLGIFVVYSVAVPATRKNAA